jgi:hypothetical protein
MLHRLPQAIINLHDVREVSLPVEDYWSPIRSSHALSSDPVPAPQVIGWKFFVRVEGMENAVLVRFSNGQGDSEVACKATHANLLAAWTLCKQGRTLELPLPDFWPTQSISTDQPIKGYYSEAKVIELLALVGCKAVPVRPIIVAQEPT